jgi:HEAT repeat protein
MGPRTCPSCRRLNPPLAVYCWFDGVPLATGTCGSDDRGLTPPPHVELRTREVALQGPAGGSTIGLVVLYTPEKRPVYAHAQSDQPWLSAGPMECRGPEAVIPLTVAAVPACPGQTLHAQLSVQANGNQHFQVPVHLHVEPPIAIEVQQEKSTGQSLRPAAEPPLPPLPAVPPTLCGAPLPPLPEWAPPEPDQAPIPPPEAMPASDGGPSRWGLALMGLLVVGVLALAGGIAWMADRNTGSGSSKKPPAETPATGKPAPPTTKKTPGGEPDNSRLRNLVRQLTNPDLETNRKAIEELASLDDAEARRAIPALVGAARRHDDEGFRQRAAQELQRLGPPLEEEVDCLKDALRVPHPALRRYVLSALKKMGEQARAAGGVLAEALKHPDPEVRREALAIVKSLGPTARVLVFRPLLNPAGDAEAGAVRDALGALLELGPATSDEIDVPMEALADGKRRIWVRCFAADLLAEAGPQGAPAVPVLLGVLQDNSDVTLFARSIRALGRIGDRRPEVLARLASAALSHREEKIRLESLQVLKRLDPAFLSIAQILERWTAEKGTSVQPALAELLGTRLAKLKPEAMTELRPLLRHKDPTLVRMGLKVVQDRKEGAASVAAEVAALLEHSEAGVRGAALEALRVLGPAAAKALPNLSRSLLDRWLPEKDAGVREALAGLLRTQLVGLMPEAMTEQVLPLLRHKDPVLVQVGLKVVQDRKEEAEAVAPEVAALLEHDAAAVRGAAVAALEALGPAAPRAVPRLSRLLLDRRVAETDAGVRQALARLLETRLAALKPEEMIELRPLLRHKDPALIQVGLKVVQDRKEDAAAVAPEVAVLLEHDNARVRETALAALKALGPGARKALPQLFEVLDQMPRKERTFLVLIVAGILDVKDAKSVERLVPFLLGGLHPEALQAQGGETETAIHKVLGEIGQPAVAGIFAILDPDSRGKDEINYRKNLYNALAGLGRQCRSEDNHQRLRELRDQELKKKYSDVIDAAGRALAAMNPK